MEAFVPPTLQEAIVYFASPENCLNYLAAKRWPDGVVKCPTCGSASVSFLKKHLRWQCSTHHPKRQFSIKVGTIMEDSPIGLDKWLPAMWLITNCKNGVSSWEIHRAIGVTQKTAWFMLHRIRLAHQGELPKFSGTVEADETYVGGKAEFMHMDRRTRKLAEGTLGRGGYGKAIVFGLLDRKTKKARVKVIKTPKKGIVRGAIAEHVETGSAVYTDALKSYRGLTLDGFIHDFIDHAEAYARGAVHTNGLENFWSLMKRSLKGTYVSVEPFHLQAYADEQAFRYNNRQMTDSERFDLVMRQIVGKRITYTELIGRESSAD